MFYSCITSFTYKTDDLHIYRSLCCAFIAFLASLTVSSFCSPSQNSTTDLYHGGHKNDMHFTNSTKAAKIIIEPEAKLFYMHALDLMNIKKSARIGMDME